MYTWQEGWEGVSDSDATLCVWPRKTYCVHEAQATKCVSATPSVRAFYSIYISYSANSCGSAFRSMHRDQSWRGRSPFWKNATGKQNQNTNKRKTKTAALSRRDDGASKIERLSTLQPVKFSLLLLLPDVFRFSSHPKRNQNELDTETKTGMTAKNKNREMRKNPACNLASSWMSSRNRMAQQNSQQRPSTYV